MDWPSLTSKTAAVVADRSPALEQNSHISPDRGSTRHAENSLPHCSESKVMLFKREMQMSELLLSLCSSSMKEVSLSSSPCPTWCAGSSCSFRSASTAAAVAPPKLAAPPMPFDSARPPSAIRFRDTLSSFRAVEWRRSMNVLTAALALALVLAVELLRPPTRSLVPFPFRARFAGAGPPLCPTEAAEAAAPSVCEDEDPGNATFVFVPMASRKSATLVLPFMCDFCRSSRAETRLCAADGACDTWTCATGTMV